MTTDRILFVAIVASTLIGTSALILFANKYTERMVAACAARGGHMVDGGRARFCITDDGRIIEL